jgi:hydroxyacylglutathione hydrolase
MLIEQIESGPLATNGYLVCDQRGGHAMAVDAPLGCTAAMVETAHEWGSPIELLVNTHGHFDHIWDNAALLAATKARLGIHKQDERLLTMPQTMFFGFDEEVKPTQADFYLAEGEPLRLGTLTFDVYHCPGHSRGSVVLVEPTEKVAFVGDVLFAGSIGRTDLPGGDHEVLLRSIQEKLMPLGDDVRVYSGHGPSTTIGRERRTNPFLLGAVGL